MSENATAILSNVFCEVLETQAFMFAEPAGNDEFPEDIEDCVSTEVGFRGNRKGEIHLTVPENLAIELAANIIGLELDDDQAEEKAYDALREILNIICGNFITELYGEDEDVSPTIPETKKKKARFWKKAMKDKATECFFVDDIPVMIGFEEK